MGAQPEQAWWARTEFWVTVATVVGAVATYEAGVLPGSVAGIMMAVAAVAYALARGLAKYNGDFAHGYRSSEFWVAVGAVAVMALTVVPDEHAAFAAGQIAAVLAAYALARGLAKPAGAGR